MTTIPFVPKTSSLFRVRQSGNPGLEIISPSGKVVAGNVDPLFGHLVCVLVNEFMVNDYFLDAILRRAFHEPVH